MTKIDVLVAEFNADFSVNKVALQGLLERNDLVYLDDTETMYSISNRKEHVCQMFGMYNRGEITKSENKELQARTKGYAVDTALTIARPMRAAMNGEQVVEQADNSELEALRAQVAEMKQELSEKNTLVRTLTGEVMRANKEKSILKRVVKQLGLQGLYTKEAAEVIQSLK